MAELHQQVPVQIQTKSDQELDQAALTDDFVQASVALSKAGAKAMTQEADEYQYEMLKDDEQGYVEYKQALDNLHGRGQWEDGKLNDNGVLKFGELGFTNVRGANLSGLELELTPGGKTIRLDDFLLSASVEEIERVMPKMVWQYKDTEVSQATIFSSNESINDTIRERLAGGSSQYDGHAVEERNDLRNYDAPKSELLYKDRWEQGDVASASLTCYQYAAKQQLENEFFESKQIQPEDRLAFVEKSVANKNQVKGFVRSEYETRGQELVNSLREQDSYIETAAFVNARNDAQAQLTSGLKERVGVPVVATKMASAEVVVEPVVAVSQSYEPEQQIGGEISDVVRSLDSELADLLRDNNVASNNQEALDARIKLEEFLFKATAEVASWKDRGFDPKNPVEAPGFGEEKNRAVQLDSIASTVQSLQELFDRVEDKFSQISGENPIEAKIVDLTARTYADLLDVDTEALRWEARRCKEAGDWVEKVSLGIEEARDLQAQYNGIAENGSLVGGDDVSGVELLRRKGQLVEQWRDLEVLLKGTEVTWAKEEHEQHFEELTRQVFEIQGWDDAVVANIVAKNSESIKDASKNDMSEENLSELRFSENNQTLPSHGGDDSNLSMTSRPSFMNALADVMMGEEEEE